MRCLQMHHDQQHLQSCYRSVSKENKKRVGRRGVWEGGEYGGE